MNPEFHNLLRSFQSVVVSYQDISAIYTKLFTQGQVQKLAALFHEIYDEEHVFTLTELQKYCTENGQREDDFIAEQYELNAGIFRRNLTLIIQNLVEEVGKKFLEKFKQDFSSARNPEEQQLQYEENQIADQSHEKSQYKSNMPEIQEETEQSAGVQQVPTSSTFRVKSNENESESDQHTPSHNNKFDLNINDLNRRPQTQPNQGPVYNQNHHHNNQPVEYQNYQYHQQQPDHRQRSAQKHPEEQQYRRAYTNEQDREEAYHNAISSLRNEEFNSVGSDPSRYEGFSQYDAESINYKTNLQRYFKQPGQNSFNQFTPGQYSNHTSWSSPERSRALAQKSMTPTGSQRKVKPTSPDRSVMNTSGSYVNRTISRWSSSNERPDPSILDSEFCYGNGKSFAKSPKKFHWDINKVPGPGQYELDESKRVAMSTAPDHSFTKSPKKFHWDINKVPGPGQYELDESKKLVQSTAPDHAFPKSSKEPSYFRKSNVPGPIYYPIKSVCSK